MEKNILVFGAGELQESLIKNVKKMGYRAIAIDPDPNAYAKNSADLFFEVAGNDFLKTLEIAKKHQIRSVVTTATDNPLPMMATIAKELDLLFPSYDSVNFVLDKGKFKEILKTNKIPCAKGAVYHVSETPDISRLAFPLIIKPNNNSGSRGVVKCSNKKELQHELKQVSKFCKDDKYIVEEYIKGDEISVEGLVVDGKVRIVQITDKYTGLPPYNVEIAHVQPSRFLKRLSDIQNILQNVIDVTGLNHCAIHPELKINSSGIFVIEIGPRLGGGYITSDLVPLSTGINIEQEMIKLSLGHNVDLNRKINETAMIQYIVMPKGCVVSENISEDILKTKHHLLCKININVKENEIIKEVKNGHDRHGWFIMKGNNNKILMDESKRILAKILNLVEEQCYLEKQLFYDH